mgnify:CR=1 FL=1
MNVVARIERNMAIPTCKIRIKFIFFPFILSRDIDRCFKKQTAENNVLNIKVRQYCLMALEINILLFDRIFHFYSYRDTFGADNAFSLAGTMISLTDVNFEFLAFARGHSTPRVESVYHTCPGFLSSPN